MIQTINFYFYFSFLYFFSHQIKIILGTQAIVYKGNLFTKNFEGTNDKSFAGKLEVEEWGEKFEIPYSGSTVALKMMVNDLNISNKRAIVGGKKDFEYSDSVYFLDMDNRTFEIVKNTKGKIFSRNFPLAFVSHNNLHVIGGFCTSITLGNFVPQVSSKVFEMNEIEVVPLKEEIAKPIISGNFPMNRISVNI